jgi:hypothetical protein
MNLVLLLGIRGSEPIAPDTFSLRVSDLGKVSEPVYPPPSAHSPTAG